MKFLKELAPLYCGVVEESPPPTALPGILEAQPSTEGLCEVWTVEEAELPDQLMASSPPAAKPKPDYNHPFWPSPKTKRFAKHIAKHSGKTDPKSIKTHEDALEFLAQWPKISVDDLLKMSMRDYQNAYACWSIATTHRSASTSVFPLGTAPATWWC